MRRPGPFCCQSDGFVKHPRKGYTGHDRETIGSGQSSALGHSLPNTLKLTSALSCATHLSITTKHQHISSKCPPWVEHQPSKEKSCPYSWSPAILFHQESRKMMFVPSVGKPTLNPSVFTIEVPYQGPQQTEW